MAKSNLGLCHAETFEKADIQDCLAKNNINCEQQQNR